MEVLFDNPIILAILIGLISMFFKNLKGNGQGKNRHRPLHPVAGRMAGDPGTQESSSETDRTAERNIEEIYRSKKAEYQELQQDISPASDNSPKKIDLQRSAPTDSGLAIHLKPDSEKLVEGLIWAEVLGPPRSKKPHHTMGGRTCR
ncbi:hypothetical protein [Bacillus sp. T33-2]|uniref:hypothetical protein n=1 Tax=Bacillus sp. T33-2 TaxID=2054168 RepID=UPI000C7693F3|nr:hypothetical protein [Bacillus sp. T33-2]PLR93820.1 hypothetical protein CVD19_19045 [Bacillus sp. T33-2]